jgi:hypothetical protein
MATKMTNTPHTQNTAWGFWGTWQRNFNATDRSTARAWAQAVDALVVAGFTAEQARRILDSRIGRHMADQVAKRGDVESTVQRLVAHRGWRSGLEEAAKSEDHAGPV